jgi:hypothetical protein
MYSFFQDNKFTIRFLRQRRWSLVLFFHKATKATTMIPNNNNNNNNNNNYNTTKAAAPTTTLVIQRWVPGGRGLSHQQAMGFTW